MRNDPGAAPRVTLAVPTCNVARYLPLALDSLLAQDFGDFELVVSDNASTDGTWDICEQYAAKDDRIRLYRNERNIGLSANFARLVSLARGEFFRFCAHDDVCAPSLVRRCVEALDEAGPRAVLAHSQIMLIDAAGNELGPDDDPRPQRHRTAFRRVAGVSHHLANVNELFGLIRTSVLRRTRGLTPLHYTDAMLVSELAIRGEFLVVPERLFYRRLHDESAWYAADGEEFTDADMAEWLEPGNQLALPGFRGHLDVLAATVGATLRSELPVPVRLSGAAGFLAGYGGRRVRVWLGRWRRRLPGGGGG
jgi:glycosyltransferase involved in cell wall biosynthesis